MFLHGLRNIIKSYVTRCKIMNTAVSEVPIGSDLYKLSETDAASYSGGH